MTGAGMAAGVRIIGVGSPHGDDWLGWEIAERLRASAALAAHAERVRVTLHDRPGAALLEAWREGGLVVLLDAVRSDREPGHVHRLDAREIVARPRMLSTHGFGVAEAVQLAAALDALPEELRFYGIEADPGHRAAGLSAAVEAAIPGVVAEIEDLVCAYLSPPAGRG